MAKIQGLLRLATLAIVCHVELTQSGSCAQPFGDYFCGSDLDRAKWSDSTGVSTGGAKVEMTRQATGGVRLQGRRHLVSTGNFLPTTEAGVVVEGGLQFDSSLPQSREFSLCTRTDGEALIQGTDEALLPPSSGIRSSTSKFFVQNGACLHLAADEVSSAWRMTILFVGELASHCESSNTVELDFSPDSGAWAFELDDLGNILQGKVTLGKSANAPAWVEVGSGTCANATIGSYSEVSSVGTCEALCDEMADTCAFISFSSTTQSCSLLSSSCSAADLSEVEPASANVKTFTRSSVFSVEASCSSASAASHSKVSLFDGYQECTASATTTAVCEDGKYPSVTLTHIRVAQTCGSKDPLASFSRDFKSFPCQPSGFPVPASGSLAGMLDMSIATPAPPASPLPGSMLLLLLNVPRSQYAGADISTALRLEVSLSTLIPNTNFRPRCPRYPTPQVVDSSEVAAFLPLDASGPATSPSDPFAPGSVVAQSDGSGSWLFTTDPAGDPRGAVEIRGAAVLLPFSEALNPSNFSFCIWIRAALCDGACAKQTIMSSTNNHTADAPSGWALSVDERGFVSVIFAVRSTSSRRSEQDRRSHLGGGFVGGESEEAGWRTATDSKAPIVVGEWTQIVGTMDESQLRVYVNGRMAVAAQFGGAWAFAPNSAQHSSAPAPLLVGGMASAALEAVEEGSEFLGAVAQVVVYGRALSAREESALWGAASLVSNPTTATGLGTHVAEPLAVHALFFCPAASPTTYQLGSKLFETTDLLAASPSPAGGIALAGGEADPATPEGGRSDLRLTYLRLPAQRVRSVSGELAALTLEVPAPGESATEHFLSGASLRFSSSPSEAVLLMVQFPALGIAAGGVDSALVEVVLSVDGAAIASKAAQLQAVAGDLSGTRAFKALQIFTLASDLASGDHLLSLSVRLQGQTIASSAVAQGPWAITAVRTTGGAAAKTFVPAAEPAPGVAEDRSCSALFDAPQSVRAGSDPVWSAFPAPLTLDLNITSSSQSLLLVADLGRIQAEVVAIMSLRIVVRDCEGAETTAAVTAVPIFNGAAGQAPTFHGVVELTAGRYSVSVEYWSPSSAFAYRLCDLAAPQHRLISFTLPEAQLTLSDADEPPQPGGCRGERSDSGRKILPAASQLNLVRSCGCDAQEACMLAGDGDASLAADGDTSTAAGCTVVEGGTGERGVWTVDFGEAHSVDVVSIWVEEGGDTSNLDNGSVHIGMSETWSENPACSGLWNEMVSDQRVVAVSCTGLGRYLSVVLAVGAVLPLCEVQVRQSIQLAGAGFLQPPQDSQGVVLDGSMFANPCSGAHSIEFGGSGLTLAAWVRIDSNDMLSGTTFLVDISREADATSSVVSYNVQLSLRDGIVTYSVLDGECSADALQSCAAVQVSATAIGSLTVGMWTHITVVHDSASTATILLDGIQVADGNVPPPARFKRRSCLVGMGWEGWGVSTRLAGAIQDLFLWDSALPSSDILPIKNRFSIPSERLVLSFANQGSAGSPAASARIGGSACERTMWASPTAVGGVTPPGVGREVAAVLTLPNRGLVTKVGAFDYQKARVEVHNVSALSAAQLTLSGGAFGQTDYSPAGQIGDTACESSQWQSDSSLLCSTPAGVHTVGITVSVAAQALAPSQQAAVFAHQHPVVTALEPATASFESLSGGSGEQITLFGSRFGESDFSAVGQVGSTVCLSSQWVSSSAIVCGLRGGVGTGLAIRVLGAGKVQQSCVAVRTCGDAASCEEDQREAIAPGCDGNATLEEAQWMCDEQGGRLCRKTELENDVSDSTSCEAMQGSFWTRSPCCEDGGRSGVWRQSVDSSGQMDWSCSPAGSAASAKVKCCFISETCWQGIDDIPELTQAFSYTAPHVKELEFSYEFARQIFVDRQYNAPPAAEQTSIWMVGSNFGTADFSSTPRVGGTACQHVSWTSDSILTCAVPSGFWGARDVTMEVMSQVGTLSEAFSYDGPLALRAAPGNQPTHADPNASVPIVLFGNNFGLWDMTPRVKVGGTSCSMSQWVSDSAVLCGAPSGVAAAHDVGAQISHNQSMPTAAPASPTSFHFSLAAVVSYNAPSLEERNRTNLPTTGSTMHTIAGQGFGAWDMTPTVFVGGSAALLTTWVSDSSLTFLSPPGLFSDRKLGIEVSDQFGTCSEGEGSVCTLSYDRPTLSRIVDRTNAPSSGGVPITVLGSDFGLWRHSQLEMHVGDTACQTTTWQSGSSLVCRLPPGYTDGADLRLQLKPASPEAPSSPPSLLSTAFTYDGILPPSPIIHQLLDNDGGNANAPAAGGSTLTIIGSFLGPQALIPPPDLQIRRGTPDEPRFCVFGFVLVPVGTAPCPYMEAQDVAWTASIAAPQFPSGLAAGTACLETRWVSSSSLLCTVPPGSGSEFGVRVDAAWFATPNRSLASGFSMRAEPGANRSTLAFDRGTFSYDAPALDPSKTVSDTEMDAMCALGNAEQDRLCQIWDQISATSRGAPLFQLRGANFGSYDLSPAGRIGYSSCEATHWASDNAALCLASAGVGSTVSIALSILDARASFNVTDAARVPPPREALLEQGGGYNRVQIGLNGPLNVPRHTMDIVTILGMNLGRSDYSARVRAGATFCPLSAWTSDTAINCRPPAGVEAARPASVLAFSNHPNSSESMELASALESSVADGTLLYAVSRDEFFLSDRPKIRTVFGYTKECVLGAGFDMTTSATSASAASSSSTEGGPAVSQTNPTITPTPSATNISDGSGRRLLSELEVLMENVTCLLSKGVAGSSGDGGETVTLVGGGFGIWDTSVAARVGETACEASAWVSDSITLCRTPRGSHNDTAFLPMVVTIAGTASDEFVEFQYDGVGAVRLQLEGEPWVVDKSDSSPIEVIEGQVMPRWQQPRVRLVDAFNRTAVLSESLVTASLIGDSTPTLLGTAVLQGAKGLVEYTDLRLDGVSRAIRLRFTSPGLGSVESRWFDARRGDCKRALTSVSVTSGMDTGGVPLRINLASFREVQPDLVRIFFSAHHSEPPYVLHMSVDASVTANEQFDELVLSALTPNWGTETPRIVNVSLDLTGSSLAPTARPCFDFFMIESDVIVIASMAPRTCSTFTNFGPQGNVNLIIHDPTNKRPFPDAWDGVVATVGSGAQQGSSPFDATNELAQFTKIGLFACPPMAAPGVYQVALVESESSSVICCEHTRYEPDGGFQVRYVPPASVIVPLDVFEIGAPAQLTLYFPRRFLDPAAPPMESPSPISNDAWSQCVLFFGDYSLDRLESGFSPISVVSSSDSGDQATIAFMTPNVTQSSLPEGPSVLPVSLQCSCANFEAHECGAASSAISTGAKLTIRRLPKLRAASPESVYVTGGKVVLRVSSPAFPLPSDSLLVTASFRLPSGEITLAQRQVRGELVTINPKLANVQVTLPAAPDYLEGCYDITITPLGQSELMIVEAVVSAIAPSPEILEMNPATLTTDGGQVTITAAFLRANTDISSMTVTVGVDTVSITRIEYSDFLETRLSFPAPALAPGSTPFTLSATSESERTAAGVLLIQAPQVRVTCDGFRLGREESEAVIDASLDQEGMCIAPAGAAPSPSEAPPRQAVATLVLSVAGSPGKQVTSPAFKIQGEEVGVTASSDGRTLLLRVPSASLGIRLSASQPPVRVTAVAEGSLVLVDSAGGTEEVEFVVRFAYLFPPRMQEVRFGNTGTFLTIVWSQPTDMAGLALGEEFSCDLLFSIRSGRDLGRAPICSFDTSDHLRLVLGENERGTADTRLVPRDYLSVRQRNASLSSTRNVFELRTIDTWSGPAYGDAEVLVPSAAQPATVWLDGPSVVPSCASDPLSITAVVTSTRDVQVVWGSDDDDLDATLASITGLTAELRSTDLVIGQLYTIFVDVTDFLGSATPRVSTQLEVTAGLIPVVKIEATGPFYRSQASLVFGAITQFSSCETDKTKLVFDWKIFVLPAQSARRRSFLDRRDDVQALWVGSEQSFEVPTALLTDAEAVAGSSKFEVTLTAGGLGKLQSSAALQIEFDQQALVVGVIGGDRVHFSRETLVLDASLSYDPDLCPEGCEEGGLPGCVLAGWSNGDAPVRVCEDPNLVIAWTCTIGSFSGGVCRKRDMTRLEIAAEIRVEVDTSDVDGNPSELFFTLTASKGNRQSTTAVTIGLQTLLALEAEIIPLVPQPSWNSLGVFQVVDFEDFKARSRLSNASIDMLAADSPGAVLFYSWDMLDTDQAIPEPLALQDSGIAPLGRLGALFALTKFVLGQRKHYVIEVRISAETESGVQVASGMARMAIVVNGPPEGGYCTVEPSEGVGLKTLFRFQCFKWNDVEVPLKYVFGYRSVDGSVTSEGEATVKPDKNLRLPAGDWQAMMLVQDDLGSRTPPQLALVAVEEDTDGDGSREAVIEAQMNELDQLGDATSTTQSADAAGSEVNGDAAGSRRRGRRLLASSAAYRMRVRRLLLRKMSGNPASANPRSAAAQMGSQMKLSSQPTEVVPATGADEDGSQGESALAASIAAIEVQGDQLPLREILQDAGANLLQTCDQIIGATIFLPPERRSEIFIRSARAVFLLRDKISSQILVGEAPKLFTQTSSIALALHRVALPTNGHLLIGPSALVNQTARAALQDLHKDEQQLSVQAPSASALDDITGLLGSIAFAVVVPQSILDATEREVMVAPTAFKHAWNILGTPQEVLGRTITSVAILEVSASRAAANVTRRRRRGASDLAARRAERDIEFNVGGSSMPVTVSFDIASARSRFNSSEADYFRRKAYVAIKCLHWSQIEWDVVTCNASNITNATVRCDCSTDGAVTVVFKYVDDSKEERFAVHSFSLQYTANWAPILYLVCVGIVLAFVVWLLDSLFSASVRRISMLYRHDMEYFVPQTRGYHKMATGWFGSHKGHRHEWHEGWVRISSFLQLDLPADRPKHVWRDKFLLVGEGSAQYYASDDTNVHTRNGCLRMEGSELLLLEEARQWMEDRGWDKTNMPEYTKTTFILLGERAAAETMAEESAHAKQRPIKKMAMMGGSFKRAGSIRHRLEGSFKEKLQVVPSQVETPAVLICQAQSQADLARWVDAVVCCKARARSGGMEGVYHPTLETVRHGSAENGAGATNNDRYQEQDSAEWGLEGKWMKLLAECKFMDQRIVGKGEQRRSGLLPEDMFRLAVANALEPDSTDETWEERGEMLVAAEAYVQDADRNRNGDVLYTSFIRRRTGHQLVDSATAAIVADQENGIVRTVSDCQPESPKNIVRAPSDQSLISRLQGAPVSGVESSFVGAGDASLVLERASPTPAINYISQSPAPNLAPMDNWPLLADPVGNVAHHHHGDGSDGLQAGLHPAPEQRRDLAGEAAFNGMRTRSHAELHLAADRPGAEHITRLESEMLHAAHDARTHHKYSRHADPSRPLSHTGSTTHPAAAPERPSTAATGVGGAATDNAAAAAIGNLTLQTQPHPGAGAVFQRHPSSNPSLSTAVRLAPVPPPRSSRSSVSSAAGRAHAPTSAMPAASAPSWEVSDHTSGLHSGDTSLSAATQAAPRPVRALAPPEHGPWHKEASSPHLLASSIPSSPEPLVPAKKPRRVGLSSHWVQARPELPPELDIVEEGEVGTA